MRSHTSIQPFKEYYRLGLTQRMPECLLFSMVLLQGLTLVLARDGLVLLLSCQASLRHQFSCFTGPTSHRFG